MYTFKQSSRIGIECLIPEKQLSKQEEIGMVIHNTVYCTLCIDTSRTAGFVYTEFKIPISSVRQLKRRNRNLKFSVPKPGCLACIDA